jgi:hypothetical protein
MQNPSAAATAASSPLVDPNLLRLENQCKSGANWFYWIAALSLVNSMVQAFGGTFGFVVGLGVTQVFDAVGRAAAETGGSVGTAVRGAAFVLDLFAAGVFALFGFLAGKRMGWAFVVGMALYALDGLLFLLVGDILSIAFHAFALVGIFVGLRAQRALREADARQEAAGTRSAA